MVESPETNQAAEGPAGAEVEAAAIDPNVHDQAKAELMSDKDDDEEREELEEDKEEVKEEEEKLARGDEDDDDEVFQDCLDEEQFAKQIANQNEHSDSNDENDDNSGNEQDEEAEEEAEEEEEVKVEQNLEAALATKLEGNQLYKENDHQGAIDKYTLAIAQCPDSETKQKAMMHNNLGMVLMRLYEPTEAEKEAEREREEAERLANPQLFKSTL